MPYGRTKLDDTLADDYADLDSILENGRWTPSSTNSVRRQGYRISFRSVDDDELQHVMRGLVTPVPSAPQTHHDDDMRYRHRLDDARSCKSGSSKSGHDRSESVMLFRKLNNGDDDVSLDLVSSELKDFIDPALLEDTMSRPASRTPSTPKKPYDESFEQQQQRHLLRQPAARNDRKHSLDARLVNSNNRQSMIDRRRSVAVVESEDNGDTRMHAMLSNSARKTEELLQAIRRTSLAPNTSDHYTSLRHHGRTTANLSDTLESMDLDVLLALKKETDAILERRASRLSNMRTTSSNRVANDDPPHMHRRSTCSGETITNSSNNTASPGYHQLRTRPIRSRRYSNDDDPAARPHQMTTTSSSTSSSASSIATPPSLRRVRTVSMPEKHHQPAAQQTRSDLPFDEPVVNLRSRASRSMIRNRESRLSLSSSSLSLSRTSDNFPETPPESVVEDSKPSTVASSHGTTERRSYRSTRRVTVCDPSTQIQPVPRTRKTANALKDDRDALLRSRRNTVSSAGPTTHAARWSYADRTLQQQQEQQHTTAHEEKSVAEMANDILNSIRQRHRTASTGTRITHQHHRA